MISNRETTTIRIVDMHTAGEPVRIVEAGYPALAGATILEKRRDAQTRFDHLRTMLMLEPRGHDGMYGVIPTDPCAAGADLAVLFTHQEGYSTMCGHATIAIGRWAVDTGRVALVDGRASFGLEAPCGVIRVEVEAGEDGAARVAFESVESFANALDRTVDVAGLGPVRVDIAFGGAFYAILPASRLGLSLMETPLAELVQAATAITDAIRAGAPIVHPAEPDLGFLYGTILTDDVAPGAHGGRPSYNLCIFADGQIDRSPTGSGVTARIALAAAKGEIQPGDSCDIRGVSGEGFVGTLASATGTGIDTLSRVRVSGQAWYSGRSEMIAEPGDRFAAGFAVPRRLADLDAPA
ncbi:MAG TPA: proline racemase family protein [Sphingopyxis sp.]|uniref:proline racemase family protein n=1 Tax=Sphingopyxis sp. TaxID=1908224 RepID=UPI002C63253E|nr:proline racemase family protein [Sphingopyxis sp.]HWW57205.1 proline racemase family protein [Sphingopyxis sp.]